MTAVIYNTDTGRILAEYATMGAAKAAYTRAAQAKLRGENIVLKGPYIIVPKNGGYPPMAVMSRKQWDEEIDYEYVGSKGFKVRLSTPYACDPNNERYWSM